MAVNGKQEVVEIVQEMRHDGTEVCKSILPDISGIQVQSFPTECSENRTNSCAIAKHNLLSPLGREVPSVNGNDDAEMAELQETLRTLSIGRMSPMRMRSVSPSPPNHFSLSPGPARRRANTFTAGQLNRPPRETRAISGWCSPPFSPAASRTRRRISTARDPVQPSSGSFSDISSDRHSSGSGEGDDEGGGFSSPGQQDLFPTIGFGLASRAGADRAFRPRSRTCPENRAWRKKKLRVLNRPPTPPPHSTSPQQHGFLTSHMTSHNHNTSLDVPPGSPCRSPLGGSMERLSVRSSSRELPSFEEEDVS